MCGIAGLIDLRERRPIDVARLERMTATMAARGPDGGGIWHEDGVGFGHRRLAVIDPSNGAQPMLSPDGRYVTTFNGMIYNHVALRTQLQQQGATFKTHCDTEVLLHSYAAQGDAMLYPLDGFFAFAVWDRAAQSLLLARDVVGKKPLYYSVEDGWLVFASDLAAVLKGLRSTPDLRPDAIEDYLTLGYVPDPKSIFKNIYKLAPGHAFSWRRGQPFGDSVCYQRFYYTTPATSANPTEQIRELETLLDAAVAKRLMADVPLGSFLSGGLDSALVTAIATRHVQHPLRTLTAAFDTPALDESAAARQTISVLPRLNPYELQISAADVPPFAASVRLTTEPFADASLVPTALLCHAAAQQVTTVLSGDGGDELFAGYARYPFFQHTQNLKQYCPLMLRRMLFGNLANYWPRWSGLPRALRLHSTFSALANDAPAAYLRTTAMILDADRLPLYDKGFLHQLNGYRSVDTFRALWKQLPQNGLSPLAAARSIDLQTWLPSRMLVKVDRAAGACGLEVRNPLLDKAVLEYSLKLPANLLLRHGVGKQALRMVAKSVLPDSVLERSKKGFVYPAADYFTHGGGTIALQALQNPRAALYNSGIVSTAAVQKVVQAYQAGNHQWFRPLWVLLTLDAFLAQL